MSELQGGLQTTAKELSKCVTAYLNRDLSTIHPSTIAVLSDLLVAIDKSHGAMALVTKLMTPIFAPVSPTEREGHLRGFPTLLTTRIVQSIPYMSVIEKTNLKEAFEEIAADPGSWNAEKFTTFASFSDNEIRDLFVGLTAPDAMFQIRRLQERLARTNFTKEEREKLSKRIDKIVADLSEMDPLYKYKLQHFARPRPLSD